MGTNSIVKKYEIGLDLKRPSSNREFEVVNGDTGDVIVITLTDDGSPVMLSNHRLLAVFSNSNGTFVQDSNIANGGVSISGNTISINLFPESVAPGLVECEIQIYSDPKLGLVGSPTVYTNLVTSAKFNFSCRRSILNDDSLQSFPELPMLSELIEYVTEGENERISNENNRKSAEMARVAAESQRLHNENARVAAEDARDAAEKERAANELERLNSENDRGLAEHEREKAERLRDLEETVRTGNETVREAAEKERAANELERLNSENDRGLAEHEREKAERLRDTEETVRMGNETVRGAAENARVKAEEEREKAESARASAEAARAAAEDGRSRIVRGFASDSSLSINAIDTLFRNGWYSYQNNFLLVSSNLSQLEGQDGTIQQVQLTANGDIEYRICFVVNGELQWQPWQSPLSLKENTVNKVTSITKDSTDTQYPSAKCVYELIGDAKSILAKINSLLL